MEMQNAIKLVDPRKRVEVSGFHMNQVAKSVQLIKSETYLTELMETICKYIVNFDNTMPRICSQRLGVTLKIPNTGLNL